MIWDDRPPPAVSFPQERCPSVWLMSPTWEYGLISPVFLLIPQSSKG